MKNITKNKFTSLLIVFLFSVFSMESIAQETQTSSTKTNRSVTIGQLKVQKEGSINKLEWSTASENNNAFFTLERSKDAIIFEDLKNVKAAGNSTTQINYMEYDLLPYNGISYYRLKQTDFSGFYTYSSIVSIENYVTGASVNIFPNPTNDNLNMTLSAAVEGIASIRIYNFSGLLLLNKEEFLAEGKTLLSTDISGLPKGIYTVIVSNKDFQSLAKIIKN